MILAPELPTAKPYLLRAMYEWCCEHGMTPYATVHVDAQVQVPMEFVKNDSITLNIGPDATNSLLITNECLQFKGRFGGIPKQVMVPVTHIVAIYGRESGEGMVFPIFDPSQLALSVAPIATRPTAVPAEVVAVTKLEKIKPTMTRVK